MTEQEWKDFYASGLTLVEYIKQSTRDQNPKKEDKMIRPKTSPATEKYLADHKDEKEALRNRQEAALKGVEVAAYNRDALTFADALQAATGQGGMSLACVQDGQYVLKSQLRPENIA